MANVNERCDWHIYAALDQLLIVQVRELCADEELGFDPTYTVYALNTTTIVRCLSVFLWARFRTSWAAVKMQTLLDLRGSFQSFIHVLDGKLYDVHALDMLKPEGRGDPGDDFGQPPGPREARRGQAPRQLAGETLTVC